MGLFTQIYFTTTIPTIRCIVSCYMFHIILVVFCRYLGYLGEALGCVFQILKKNDHLKTWCHSQREDIWHHVCISLTIIFKEFGGHTSSAFEFKSLNISLQNRIIALGPRIFWTKLIQENLQKFLHMAFMCIFWYIYFVIRSLKIFMGSGERC